MQEERREVKRLAKRRQKEVWPKDKLGMQDVEVYRTKKVEGVKAYYSSDDSDIHLADDLTPIVAYMCPECSELYEDMEDAANCCEDVEE